MGRNRIACAMRLFVVLLFLTVAACTARVRGPEVSVEAPSVRVTIGEPDPRFCPPGQAKKGNC